MEDGQLRDIIARCVRQDKVAQEQLFKLLYGKMLAVSLRYTNDRDRAEEVIQESFIKFFDKLEEFDFRGSFEGWVRRIVANGSIDAIRKRNRQPFTTDEEYLFNEQAEEQEYSLDRSEVEIKAEFAMQAIQKLSPAYRTVFNLYVIENYSHKEIAEILGISEGTSKSNLAKAKQGLQKQLKEKFIQIENGR